MSITFDFTDEGVEVFLGFLFLGLALVYLIIDYRLSKSSLIYLKKFAKAHHLKINRKALSYFHLDKKIGKIFDEFAKATILFHAEKKIKNSSIEFYFSQYHLPLEKDFLGRYQTHHKRLLFLEITNPRFDFGEVLMVSKKLTASLGLEKLKIKTGQDELNLRFDFLHYPINLKSLVSHIKIASLASFDIPVGIIARDHNLIIFTTEEQIEPSKLKKFWQILDWAGGY